MEIKLWFGRWTNNAPRSLVLHSKTGAALSLLNSKWTIFRMIATYRCRAGNIRMNLNDACLKHLVSLACEMPFRV